MRVLIAYASRHGGTEGIADEIGAVVRAAAPEDGHPGEPWSVEVLNAADVDDVSRYDAVVVGSAVYVGHWLGSASHLVRTHATVLSSRPVWLFSSGPVGDPAVPTTEAAEAPVLAELVGARAHRTFAGRLRSADLGLVERASVRVVHANEGDYRDWPAIRAWATDISDTLTSAVPG